MEDYDIDFDPTTSEGQIDINDDITEDEYASLITGDRSDIERRMSDEYGVSHWRRHVPSFLRMWKSHNPGRTPPPEYVELQELTPREELHQQMLYDVRERFPNVEFALVDFRMKEEGQIQVKYHNKTKWYNLYLKRGTLNEKELSKEIKRALGEENQASQLRGIQNQLSESQEELTRVRTERERIQERMRIAPPGEIVRLRQELSDKNTEIARLETTIEGTLMEKQRVLRRTAILEEQLRQREQALEDLERQLEEQRETLDNSEREEEHTATRRRLETLLEEVRELESKKENLERELGLTFKEKVRRVLVKYGLPSIIAAAIASALGVIISVLGSVGNGVRKVGKGLTDLGKKMAASIPGLLGSVLSLVLKTGGELLKFVGNNIWILVVALGAVLLKRIKV